MTAYVVVLLLGFAAVAVCAVFAQGRKGAVSVDPHEATTSNLAGLYPVVSSGGPSPFGVLIGFTWSGLAPYVYDAWELCRRNTITNPNAFVFGEIGSGKSALVKSLVWRQAAFGRRSIVIDPKGEYEPLVEALGGTLIKLTPGGGRMVLNPVGFTGGSMALEVLAAVTGAALERRLTQYELAAVEMALTQAQAVSEAAPTLPDVVAALMNLDAEVTDAEIRQTPEEVREAAMDAALALRNLCKGALRGMLDGPTTEGINWDAPLIVVDVSDLQGQDSLGVVMAAVLGALTEQLTRTDLGQKLLILDEAWRILATEALASWLQSLFKLSRSYGLQNIAVCHRPTDLDAGADAGSGLRAIISGLLSDTETRVIYAQPEGELRQARELFDLTDTEVEMIGGAFRSGGQRGVALWKVGRHSAVVQHVLSDAERALVDTEQAQRARTGLPELHPVDLAQGVVS